MRELSRRELECIADSITAWSTPDHSYATLAANVLHTLGVPNRVVQEVDTFGGDTHYRVVPLHCNECRRIRITGETGVNWYAHTRPDGTSYEYCNACLLLATV